MLREARAAAMESDATGTPIDEVTDMRDERRVKVRSQAREAAEAYNAAANRVRERGAPEDHAAAAIALENIKRVGRRDFLKGTAAAGFATAAMFRPRGTAAASAPTIAIIGGGLAGLRCAHQLDQVRLEVDDLRGRGGCRRAVRDPARLLGQRPGCRDARRVHLDRARVDVEPS
jgi:hypothetical protein